MKWSIDGIPPGSVVESAAITSDVLETSPQPFPVYPLLTAWIETEANWNEAMDGVSWSMPGASGAADRKQDPIGILTAKAPGRSSLELNAAGIDFVQGWLDGTLPNHGVIVASDSSDQGISVRSSDASVADRRPKLSIRYQPPDGNLAPRVQIGPDQHIDWPPGRADLNAWVVDDGPLPGLTLEWSQLSGPAKGSFSATDSAAISVKLPRPGEYVLRLAVSDGYMQSEDLVRINVMKPGWMRSADIQIARGEDDAEEALGGEVFLDSGDLDMMADRTGETIQAVGLRFQSIPVPPGALIIESWIQFEADEVSEGSTTLLIEGEASDDASAFDVMPGNITARRRTQNGVSWTPELWANSGAAGTQQRTPDLSPLIQEIIDIPGWRTGNDIAILISGQGDRAALAYDGNAAGAAVLHLEYACPSSQSGRKPSKQTNEKGCRSLPDASKYEAKAAARK